MSRLRIGTRESRLALWQAEHVRDRLLAADPGLEVEIVGMTTEGDRLLGTPLAAIGGKGLFLKELEQALLAGRVDIAVHSMKDVTVNLPDGLCLAAMCASADPRDAFVSASGESLDALPHGARVGTSSLRRACQLRHRRPDLDVDSVRGNVITRLARLDSGDFDALLLAVAGLERLELADRITERLAPEVMLPAVGQGVLGIECRSDDEAVRDRVRVLADADTERRVAAERAMNARLGGGCQVPIGGYADDHDGRMRLRGLVGSPDGRLMLYAEASGEPTEPEALGAQVAEMLLHQGAADILGDVYARAGE